MSAGRRAPPPQLRLTTDNVGPIVKLMDLSINARQRAATTATVAADAAHADLIRLGASDLALTVAHWKALLAQRDYIAAFGEGVASITYEIEHAVKVAGRTHGGGWRERGEREILAALAAYALSEDA